MVSKIKFIRLFLFVLFSVFMLLFLIYKKGEFESSLIKTVLSDKIANNSEIISVYNKSNSKIRAIFESNSIAKSKEAKEEFQSRVDNKIFDIEQIDYSSLLKKYQKAPENFLSKEKKKLLLEKKYNEIYKLALKELYNPFNIEIVPLEDDPYFFVSDYILSNKKDGAAEKCFDDRCYEYISLKIKDNSKSELENSNKAIEKLVKIKNSLKKDDVNVYFSGTPVHSYFTSNSAKFKINIICFLSSIFICFLTYLSFRKIKVIIPVFLSISFGILTGFFSLKVFFSEIQTLSLVFSTAIIGLGLDYSYHYLFSHKEKDFVKNLTVSLVSTIVPFILFYLTGIELLKEISVFIVFSLFAIYIFVLFIFPCFDLPAVKHFLKPNLKILKIVSLILVIVSFFGIFKFKFNDSLTSLYVPNKDLKKGEFLYEKISGGFSKYKNMTLIEGKNVDDILEKEEKLKENFNNENFEHISLSSFVPSKKTQRENFDLAKKLYQSELDNYDILPDKMKKELKNKKFTYVDFEPQNDPSFQNFFINPNMVVMFSKERINAPSFVQIDLQNDIQNFLEGYRVKLLKILPVAILIIFFILFSIYGRNSLKILAPSFLGIMISAPLASLLLQGLNLFSVISFFLILGFTIDYSVFKIKSNQNSKSAVLISFLTTSFSFLMLSFSGFKLISSISLVLLFGLTLTYCLSCFIFDKKTE